MYRKQILFFVVYLLLSTLLAALVHRDVLFNIFNYGRHWDWTFASFIEMDQNYVRSFFSAISSDALGTYGSITISDFIVKETTILLQSIFIFTPITILNKIVVFILFPVASSVGIWKLVKTIKEYSPTKDGYNLFLTSSFANILYTFSLPVIYDLHGGALNRQVSTVVLPFLFAFIYRYFKEEKSIRYLIWCGALSVFLDIANVFYISAIIGLVILLKSYPIETKIKDLLGYIASVLLVNAYWLQSVFLSSAIIPAKILSDRRLDIVTLRAYSAPFKQLLFLTSTPHNLIETVFKNSYAIYIPATVAIFLILWLIKNLNKNGDRSRYTEILFAATVYLFTSILASGTYSLGNIYMFLYSITFLGFIQNAVRFSPNLNLALIFLLLILLSQSAYSRNKYLLGLIATTIFSWAIFIIISGGFVKKTYLEVTKDAPVSPFIINNEIGSLYEADSSLLERLQGDKFVGNIIPIASLNSPTFINNAFPKASQGADPDLKYGKGILLTSGNSSTTEKYIRTQLSLPKPTSLFQTLNIQYVWINGNYMESTKENVTNHFSKKWLSKVLGQSSTPLEQDARLSKLFKVKNAHLTPVIYSSGFKKTTGSKSTMVTEFKKISETKYLVIVHRPEKKFDLVLSKQFYAGWKARIVQGSVESKPKAKIGGYTYKISESNITTQANLSELIDFINKGYISSVGDGTEKVIQFYKYKNGLRTLVEEDRSQIDYISKIFKNSIQNDNLVEPVLKNQQLQIPDMSHKAFNKYANSWTIDISKLCVEQPCLEKNDQTLTILIEYMPQKTYQIALFITGISFLMCLLIFLNLFRKWIK